MVNNSGGWGGVVVARSLNFVFSLNVKIKLTINLLAEY